MPCRQQTKTIVWKSLGSSGSSGSLGSNDLERWSGPCRFFHGHSHLRTVRTPRAEEVEHMRAALRALG